MEKEVVEIGTETENKKQETKKVKSIILMIVLIIFFLSSAIFINEDGLNKLLAKQYLEETYNSKFKILEFQTKKQYVEPGVSCDGSTFIPPKEVKGKYYYYYYALSKEDNIVFTVRCLFDENYFTDSYEDTKKVIDELSNNIIDTIGNTEFKREFEFVRREDSLIYDCNIDIFLNKNLTKEIDEKYKRRLEEILKQQNEIIDKAYVSYDNGTDAKIFFNVNIYYQGNERISLSDDIYIYKDMESNGVKINEYRGQIND